MAITKARSSSPVRGYYVTTIFTGRLIQSSGSGFGVPRLGGLINAQVDGLTGGGSGATRMPAQFASTEHDARLRKEEEKARLAEHKDWKKDMDEKVKIESEAIQKGQEVQKKLVEEAKKAEDKPKPTPPHVEIVKDPATGTERVTGKDNAVATDLDDPKQLAKAEHKTLEQQAKPAEKK